VFLKGGWVTATFVTNYMPFILFPVLYAIWKFKTGVPIVKPADMDFITGIDEIEADTYVFQAHFGSVGCTYCVLDMRNLHQKIS
jgi:amino acid permease